MNPTLNWRELEISIKQIRSLLEGQFLDRVFVPERSEFPAGYLKEEWIFRFTGQKQEDDLLISVRPKHPYIALSPKKKLKASTQATRSPFDLYLSKNLCGSKLLKLEALPQERIVVFWFSHPQSAAARDERLGLVLVLIPARPEALLVSVKAGFEKQPWPILVRSRTLSDTAKQNSESSTFSPPDGSKAPQALEVRKELIENEKFYYAAVHQALMEEAFSLRIQNAEKNLRQLLKQAKDRFEQSQAQYKAAQQEPDWKKWGDLLKASLGTSPKCINSKWQVMDYETNTIIEVPADPKYDLSTLFKRYYDHSKRKQRRLEESQQRMETFQETWVRLEKALTHKPLNNDWTSLEKFERSAGILPSSSGIPTKLTKHLNKWSGKSFVSKDGFSILVGRNKNENLELTFKIARGNDLWMHVRGRPSAHVLISMQPGKSVPLETLLDAAQILLHYSGGKEWGKTEVDYTYKKYVKRMKDSSEAIYSHNKTLLVTSDAERQKRLLTQD